MIFTQHNYTMDYAEPTVHWQFMKMLLKAKLSEQIENTTNSAKTRFTFGNSLHICITLLPDGYKMKNHLCVIKKPLAVLQQFGKVHPFAFLTFWVNTTQKC